MSEPPRNIRGDINRYVPGIRAGNSLHGFERILILLFGLAGHGKSALINSCMCVVKDVMYRNLAGAGKDDGGCTMKRKSYNLTDTIQISDNRGLRTMNPKEILEVCAQLRHLRLEEDVIWEKDNLEEIVKCIPECNQHAKEFILPVIVHSCLYNLKKDEERLIRQLIKKCHEITGIHPVVVITNVGPPNIGSGNGAQLEERFGNLGCTQKICLENYTENKQTRNIDADKQFLHFLDVCINEAEHAIGQREHLDPLQIFTKHVADQIKEEKEVKEMERKELEEKHKEEARELNEKHNEEVRKLKRELEEKHKEEARELKEKHNEEVRKLKRELEEKKCSILAISSNKMIG